MNFAEDQASAVVEYEFFNVPEEALIALPDRVNNAVRTLVRRERTPSDDDVRAIVQSGESKSSSNWSEMPSARVRVVVPESVAIDVALQRSFDNGGNVIESQPLTIEEKRRLLRKSTRFRLQRLRKMNTPEARQRRARELQKSRQKRQRRVSPERQVCIICMEKIKYRVDKVFLDACGHVFHIDCVVNWLAQIPRTCPTCRVPVDLTPQANEVSSPRTRSASRETRDRMHSADETIEI